MEMEEKSRIVLSRSSEWMNRTRSLKVMIDGQQAGTIGNGNTEEFSITPGQHTIACKIDWCSSRNFDVHLAAGETAYLHVRSGMKYYWQLVGPLLVVLILNLYFVFSEGGRPMWFNYVMILVGLPVLFYIFYYLTFGRKDYLVIVNDDKTLFGK